MVAVKDPATGQMIQVADPTIYTPDDDKPDFDTGWQAFSGTSIIIASALIPGLTLDNSDVKMFLGTINRNYVIQVGSSSGSAVDSNIGSAITQISTGELRIGFGQNTTKVVDTSGNTFAITQFVQYRIIIRRHKKRVEVIEKQLVVPGSTGVQTGSKEWTATELIYSGGTSAEYPITFPAPFTTPPFVSITPNTMGNFGGLNFVAMSVTNTGFILQITNSYKNEVPIPVGSKLTWSAMAPDSAVTDLATGGYRVGQETVIGTLDGKPVYRRVATAASMSLSAQQTIPLIPDVKPTTVGSVLRLSGTYKKASEINPFIGCNYSKPWTDLPTEPLIAMTTNGVCIGSRVAVSDLTNITVIVEYTKP